MRLACIKKAANFELPIEFRLQACPTLYYGMIACFRTSFTVLEHPFPVLERSL